MQIRRADLNRPFTASDRLFQETATSGFTLHLFYRTPWTNDSGKSISFDVNINVNLQLDQLHIYVRPLRQVPSSAVRTGAYDSREVRDIDFFFSLHNILFVGN